MKTSIYIDCCADGRQRRGTIRSFSETLVALRREFEKHRDFSVLPALNDVPFCRDDFGRYRPEDVEMESMALQADIIICLCNPPSLGFSTAASAYYQQGLKPCFILVDRINVSYAWGIYPDCIFVVYDELGEIPGLLMRAIAQRKESQALGVRVEEGGVLIE